MIETERLFIRNFLPSDAADLFEYLSMPETYRFEPGEPISMDEARDLVSERAEGSNFLAVILKQTGKLIGHLYFEQKEPPECRTWELGYIFNPKYQRMGFGSEAAAALVQYAFANLNPHRIMARCNQDNPASWKLLEKIGLPAKAISNSSPFSIRMKRGSRSGWTPSSMPNLRKSIRPIGITGLT
ncbi:MAG: hypothetical protein C0410_12025, partial [Anaerolinea sp.]|nr:hypothetical protein [Anaerolinea sp.]